MSALLKSRWAVLGGFAIAAVLLFVVAPALLSPFRLDLLGKYLCYAIVAVGIGLAWGRGGMLTLGQGVFFGLGGYCMAMFLKLEASSPENTKIQSTPGIPDFMDWNQITALPLMWVPFQSLAFTIFAVVAVPTFWRRSASPSVLSSTRSSTVWLRSETPVTVAIGETM